MSANDTQDELMRRRVEAAQRLLELLIQRDLDELEKAKRESRGSLGILKERNEGIGFESVIHPLVKQELEIWGEG